MNQKEALTIARTPATGCPACRAWRQHTDEERALYHPHSRHGYDRKQWSHPELEAEARARMEKKS
jgi:hypothetical protein